MLGSGKRVIRHSYANLIHEKQNKEKIQRGQAKE